MNISSLAKKVLEFKKSDKYPEVRKRLKEFNFESKEHHEWFSELCFCLLTANASAEAGIRVQKAIGKGFLSLHPDKLSKRLKELKYRFPNVRAKYIHEARKCHKIKDMIKGMPSEQAREFLVENVKGLGMKEASHFLRNTGRTDVAIIDRHIMRVLGHPVKSINKRNYLDMEDRLLRLAKLTKTNQAELDLILWSIQTGKVLK
jgi:N-glycosylase/DNA lyase